MADNKNKTGPSLGIPPTAPKPEKRPTFSAAGKANHVDPNSRGGAFKTFLWVAPLTALIWIYAEREQIAQYPEVSVQIKLVSKSSDRIITVLTPQDRPTKISLDVQGPRASLNELRDVLAKAPLEVNVSADVGYEGEFSLAEAITKSDLFKTYAVTVTAARPPVKIKVEAKGTRKIPVKVRPQDKALGTVTFEPDLVTVEGPKDQLDKLAAEGPDKFVAYADLTSFASKPPGSYNEEVTIALGSSTFVEAVTMRETVRAKVEISKSVSYQIPAIPIQLQISSLLLTDDKFKITAPPTLRSVDVIGPADAIESLRQFKFPAAVVIDMNDDKRFDFSTVTTVKDFPITLRWPTDYRMPKDVTVINPNKEITITVTRR
jgi:hypothetical protein